MCSASQPSFLAEVAGDAQGEALLAEQRVAAVAGADRPDGVVLREVADEALVGVAIANRVDAPVEAVGRPEPVERHPSHAGHDPHGEDDVDGVGDLDAHLGEGGAGGSHDVGDDVERAPLHGSIEQAREEGPGLGGGHPVVGGPGLFLGGRTDEREVLYAGDVVLVRVVIVATGPLRLVERDEGPGRHGLLHQPVVLGLGAVAPDDAVGLEELFGLIDPAGQVWVVGGAVRDHVAAPLAGVRPKGSKAIAKGASSVGSSR